MKELFTKLYIKSKTLTGSLSISAAEIAKFIGGEVAGDGSAKINDMSSVAFCKPGNITFASNEEDLAAAEKSPASCILTTVKKEKYAKTAIVVDDMKKALTMMYNAMLELKPRPKGEVHPTAVISQSARIGRNAMVGPYAVIEDDVKIGDNARIGSGCFVGKETVMGDLCELFSNVVLYPQTVLGDKVTIHAGSVIGADGFGYVPRGEKIYKVPQMGNVIIGDNVEIGANSCVDRGTFTTTVIGSSTKLDNLVQVAHNVKIGKAVLIAAHVGIGGSTEIGDNTMIGGSVGVSDHVTMGNNVKVGGKSGVHGKIKDGVTVMGYPAIDADDFRKFMAARSLLVKHLSRLKKLIRQTPDDGETSEKQTKEG